MDKDRNESKTHRWNVEEIDGGIRLCRGMHDKNEACEWEEYFPAPQSPVAPGVDELRYIISNKDNAAKVIHDILLANARESRDGVVNALERAKVYIEWERDCKLHVGRHVGQETGILTAINEALATVGKEG